MQFMKKHAPQQWNHYLVGATREVVAREVEEREELRGREDALSG
jgi:hypothetical protein